MVGGCRPDGEHQSQRECFTDWYTALLTRMLNNANAVVLLSVGAGVLELRTLTTLVQNRLKERLLTPVSYVWLIDPFVSKDYAIHVEDKFRQRLSMYSDTVDVKYFCGETAYESATEELFKEQCPKPIVGIVGGLNYSLGPLGNSKKGREMYVHSLNFIQLLGETNPQPPPVVQAYWMSAENYKVRKETLKAYLDREYKYVYSASAFMLKDMLDKGEITTVEFYEQVKILQTEVPEGVPESLR